MPNEPPPTPALELAARDLAVFWHPCGQMLDYRDFPPLDVVSARGARLTLSDGREILDAIASWWCKALGHGHPGVLARIRAQMDRFEHVIAANTTNAALVELCERLLALANGAPPSMWGPRAGAVAVAASALGAGSASASGALAAPVAPTGPYTKVFLADNGSTAVEIALKMALQAQAQRGQPGRTQFAALDGGYHGETVGALSVGDLGLYGDPYASMMFPVTKLGPLPLRRGTDDPAWQDAAVEWPAIEAALAPRASSLAAIIYEPVLQAAGGMRLYSPELLRRLRAFADAHGVYLIADEIASGFGRLGVMLAGDLAADARTSAPTATPAPRPDFLALSKGLTAGMLPLSAVLTTQPIYDLFLGDWSTRRAFLHSNTHTGNALGVAAALGALDAFATEGVLDHVAAHGPRLRAALDELARTRPTLTGVRGMGMMAAMDLRAPSGAALDPAARTGYRVYREAVRRGALLRPLGDTMYLFPPLNTPPADLDAMVAVLADATAAVLGAG